MSTNEPLPAAGAAEVEVEIEETDEISVEITEDDLVWVHGEDWELLLSPAEARLLAEALNDAANDAEAGAAGE